MQPINFDFKNIERKEVESSDQITKMDFNKAHKVLEKSNPNIKKLQALADKHPSNPKFVKSIILALNVLKKYEEAEVYCDQLVQQFPDYVYGKICSLDNALLQNKLDKCTELIGDEIDLQAAFPQKESFHINEISEYYGLISDYLAQCGRIDEAIDILKQMKKIECPYLAIEVFTERVISAYNNKLRSNMPVTLNLHHPELNVLTTQGINIDLNLLKSFLTLNRTTLIQDLEHLIHYSIGTYDLEVDPPYDDLAKPAIFHATKLLEELKAYESLPVILEPLLQDESFIEYMFFDLEFEMLSQPIAILGIENMKALSDFLRNPLVSEHLKNIVCESIEVYWKNYPEKKDDIQNWIKAEMQYVLDNESLQLEYAYNAFLVGTAIGLQLRELLPVIKQLVDADLVDESISGNYDDIVKHFEDESPIDFTVKRIEERYEEISDILSNDDFEEESYNTPRKAAPKIGRNEPCPCGSGKKYKRCCGKN